MQRWLCCLLVVLAGVFKPCIAQADNVARVDVYPQCTALAGSSDYAVRVRVPGGIWQPVSVYAVPVSMGIDIEADVRSGTTKSLGGSRSAFTSMALFDFSERVEVEIRKLHGGVSNYRIRPENDRVPATAAGDTIRFVLDKPRNLSIEFDGDLFHNLQLFAGRVPESDRATSGTNTIYYGPGLHLIGTLSLPSGTNVYLAGGAVVVGAFSVTHAHDVRIEGHGILASPRVVAPSALQSQPLETTANAETSRRRHDAILVEYAKNVRIAGLTVISAGYTVLTGQSENVEIDDLKSFSAGGNNDGIDVFSSRHVLIDRVFLRNSDDTIALYGHRWNYFGDLNDVTVTNSTLWADVAHPILVGTHGDSEHPETISNLVFRNLDILDHREPQLDYQGCMSLNAGDGNLIQDVRFEDIRVDDFRMGQLLNLRVMFNHKYNTSPGHGIENVVFRNISYNGTHAGMSMIAGYDDQRAIRNVRFEGLTINGVRITDTMKGKPGFYKTSDIANIFIGEHVEGVTFSTAERGR